MDGMLDKRNVVKDCDGDTITFYIIWIASFLEDTKLHHQKTGLFIDGV